MDQYNLELYLTNQNRGMLLAALQYPLKNFIQFNASRFKAPLQFAGGWGLTVEPLNLGHHYSTIQDMSY